MSPKNFIFKFFLTVAAVLTLIYVFTYIEIIEYSSDPNPERAVLLPPAVKESSDPDPSSYPGSGMEAPAKPDIDSVADSSRYTIEKYVVSHSENGDLKNIAADGGAIIVSNDLGEDVRAVVTDATEVFRNGERVEMSDIKDTDRIFIRGRKRTEEGNDFVADSIYATSLEGAIVPAIPGEIPME